MTKTCNKCGQEQDITEYHKKLDNADGFNNICKSCIRKQRGQTKRKPPVIRPIDQEITLEVLIEDVFDAEKRSPRDWRLRMAADELRKSIESASKAHVADVLYEMWERRMKNTPEYEKVSKTYVVEERRTIKRKKARGASLTPLLEWELI